MALTWRPMRPNDIADVVEVALDATGCIDLDDLERKLAQAR